MFLRRRRADTTFPLLLPYTRIAGSFAINTSRLSMHHIGVSATETARHVWSRSYTIDPLECNATDAGHDGAHHDARHVPRSRHVVVGVHVHGPHHRLKHISKHLGRDCVDLMTTSGTRSTQHSSGISLNYTTGAFETTRYSKMRHKYFAISSSGTIKMAISHFHHPDKVCTQQWKLYPCCTYGYPWCQLRLHHYNRHFTSTVYRCNTFGARSLASFILLSTASRSSF